MNLIILHSYGYKYGLGDSMTLLNTAVKFVLPQPQYANWVGATQHVFIMR